MTEHALPGGGHAYVLAEGRQTNVAGGDGHPVEIMDLSFSVQALSAHLLARGGLEPGLHRFPDELDREIARTKLATLGLSLGEPTEKQREFESSWSVWLARRSAEISSKTRLRRLEVGEVAAAGQHREARSRNRFRDPRGELDGNEVVLAVQHQGRDVEPPRARERDPTPPTRMSPRRAGPRSRARGGRLPR